MLNKKILIPVGLVSIVIVLILASSYFAFGFKKDIELGHDPEFDNFPALYEMLSLSERACLQEKVGYDRLAALSGGQEAVSESERESLASCIY